MRCCRGQLAGLILVLAVVLFPPAAAAQPVGQQSSEQRFLAGLRARGLHQLAERYCRQQLEQAEIETGRRVELVIELSRVLAERAVESPPDVRPAIWQQTQQVVADFLQQHSQDSRAVLVRFQGALVVLARGELAHREAQLLGDSPPLRQEAKEHLRLAIRQLRHLVEEVEQRIRQKPTTAHRGQEEPSPRQLAFLLKRINYELAQALCWQGECYGPGTPDRINSLTEAIKLFEPLAAADDGEPFRWESRCELIVCHRLLGDWQAARERISAVLDEAPPAAMALRCRAERIRLALAMDKPEEALAAVGEGRHLDGVASPELDLASLETYLVLWLTAARQNHLAEADKWHEQVRRMLATIAATHGPTWKNRAETLIGSRVRQAPENADLEMLVLAAENAYRAGQFDEAVALYDRAAVFATKGAHQERAFALAFTAATIEHQRGGHAAALSRYRRLALAQPYHPKAAAAHLLAVYHAAELAKQQQPRAVEEYPALLEEHLRMWQEGPTANEVRRRLGRLREFQGNWEGAIAAYGAIPPEDPHYAQARDAVQRCREALLKKQQAEQEKPSPATAPAAKPAQPPVEPDPRDLSAQREYARQLAAGGDRASLEKALRKWGELQGNWRSGSEPWLHAQYEIAMLHYRLGNKAQAARLIRLLQAQYPELGGPELRAQFAALLAKCQ